MDVTIFHTQTKRLIEDKMLQELIKDLPASIKQKANRYQSESSAVNYAIGRRLLQYGLDYFGSGVALSEIMFQENGKPYLADIDFNISHSSHRVLCGISGDGEIGVDVEKLRPIEFEDFNAMFSNKEWNVINNAQDQLTMFYRYWTRKESIIKAMGCKLSYLHEIELDVSLDYFMADGMRWYLKDIDLEAGYIGAICTKNKITQLNMIAKEF